MYFKLQGLKLGVASAATQIEGGECDHNWNDWFRQGKILNNYNPARSTDHYNRYIEDIDLMAQMGIKYYRMGIEWARICPTENTVDESAILHYRDELSYLKEKGISVLLTIHHFTNPMWFEKKGGFTVDENLKHYLNLVKIAVNSFGDLVSEYITINEPNVYATSSFYFGEWPPGEKSFSKTIKVMQNMSICHIKAYELIHKIRKDMGFKDTKVSFANHIRVFEPDSINNPWHKFCSKSMEYLFQDAISRAMYLGVFKWPLKPVDDIKPGEYSDFIGINYYTRSTVSGFKNGYKKDTPKNDLDWEIYPYGLVRSCETIYNMIKKPIYITENGTCDNHDAFRSKYIYEHIKAICNSDLPVERYYHWCFCDNFEWIEGESARFGIVHIDYETQKRTIKESGDFYSEVIKANGVTNEIYNKYVREQKYNKR